MPREQCFGVNSKDLRQIPCMINKCITHASTPHQIDNHSQLYPKSPSYRLQHPTYSLAKMHHSISCDEKETQHSVTILIPHG